MRVLAADDDRTTRLVLRHLLAGWGYEPVMAADGAAAWEILRGPDAPPVGLVDWCMPGVEGPELCRLVRTLPGPPPCLILLTGREGAADLAAGLAAGATDFVRKPFDEVELRARVGAAARAATAERELAARVAELEAALAQNRSLRQLLPVCAWCKAVRSDADYWQRLEDYLGAQTGRRLTHGICPNCEARLTAEHLRDGCAEPGREGE
jgi:DNA-binding response OmpR family regulator